MIDKLVFNQLARREGVNLPGVGSLGVVFRPASRNGRHVEPPVNQTVFSRRKNSAWPTLPALIEREATVDPETAHQQYERWLSQARQEDGTIVIGGTGGIKNGVFTPSPELKSVIDREFSYSHIRLRKRSNPLKITLLFVLIAVIAFLAVFACLQPDVVSRMTNLPGWGVHKPDRDTVTADSASVAIIYSDTAGTGTEELRQTEIPSATATTQDGVDNQTIAPESTMYHLVAGVFSTDENADRFIADSKRKGAPFPYRKVVMHNGRIVVSIFASPDKSETDRRRVEMRSTAPDLWIYSDRAGNPIE